MKLHRHISTAATQDDAVRTIRDDTDGAAPWKPKKSIRVISPADEGQLRATSQSRRMARGGSSSHWSPSELPVAGTPLRIEDEPAVFQLVRAWDGLVTGVTEATMIVRIVPLDGAGVEEEAEFLLTDVPEKDRVLVMPGAPLYWFLGYETTRGRRRRTSEVKMRWLNLPRETPEHWIEAIEAIVAAPGESTPTEG